MKAHPYRMVLALLVASASLTACNKLDSSSTSAAKPTAEEKATVPGAINSPIPPASIDLAYSIIGGPTYDPEGGTLEYKVQVTNNGKVAISSVGTRPVHLGIVILGPDGTTKTPPGKRDFVRIKFPRILEPGQSLDVSAKFRLAPTIGGNVVLDAVQEGVRWFSDYKKPTLPLGTFIYCDGSDTEICTADGNSISDATS